MQFQTKAKNNVERVLWGANAKNGLGVTDKSLQIGLMPENEMYGFEIGIKRSVTGGAKRRNGSAC